MWSFWRAKGHTLQPIEDCGRILRSCLLAGRQPAFEIAFTRRSTRTVAGLGGRTPLIGFCGAPWTVASYMVGAAAPRTTSAGQASGLSRSGNLRRFSICLSRRPAPISSARSHAGGTRCRFSIAGQAALADNDFRAFVIEPTAKIVKKVKAASSRHSDHWLSPGKFVAISMSYAAEDRRRRARLRYGSAAGPDGRDASAAAGPGQSRSAVAACWRGCYGAKGESDSDLSFRRSLSSSISATAFSRKRHLRMSSGLSISFAP